MAAVMVLLLSFTALPAEAKEPREWRVAYLDTGEIVRITDQEAALAFANAVHYSVTGGTPVEPEPERAPTAEVFGNPCNPPYSCEGLWYRYYAPRDGRPAYMSYYLADGTLYESWTTPELQATIDSYRTIPPLDDGAGVHNNPDALVIGSFAFSVLVVGATVVAVSLWAFRRRRSVASGRRTP